jgi:hypothetical protein
LVDIFFCALVITHQIAGRSPVVVSFLPCTSPVARLSTFGLTLRFVDGLIRRIPALPGGVGGFYGVLVTVHRFIIKGEV